MKLTAKFGQSILAVLLALSVLVVFPAASSADATDTLAPLAAEPVWEDTILVPTDEATVPDAIVAAGPTPTLIVLELDETTATGISIDADQTIKITSADPLDPKKIAATVSGFSLLYNDGELWLEDIVITGGYYGGNGGGVFNNGELYLSTGAAIMGNSSGHNGGGVCNIGTFNLCGGTIAENTATDNGGGVFNAGTFIMSSGLIGSMVAGNGNAADVNGGGVYNYGNTGDPDITVTFTMTGGMISHNTADKGGGVYNDGSDEDAVFNLVGGTISGNTASESGGSAGGGVYNNSDRSYTGTFNMSAGTISGNEAYASGGGVYNNGEFTMLGGNIGASGVGGGNAVTAGSGGGVYNSTDFSMSAGLIQNNTAAVNGGGVLTEGSFAISSGTVSGNCASGDGGGVYSSNGFTMSGGEISGNGVAATSAVVTHDGGGVYATGAVDISGGTISDNAAEGEGGGVCALGGPSFLIRDQALITGNEAGNAGGGVSLATYDFVEMQGGKVFGNNANSGGGMFIYSVFNMSGGSIFENTAVSGAGVSTLDLVLSGGTIIDNIASANGGGVFIISPKTLTMTGGSISGNQAVDGGGVYGAPAKVQMNITGGSISGNIATGNGGGIFTNNPDLNDLTVGPAAVFSNNVASVATKDPANLFMPAGVTWTTPFTYGNNNFDINLAGGSPAFLVFVNNSYAMPTGANGYLPGEVVTINAGSRAGYSFSGWTITGGSATLASASSATTTFTMPSNNVTLVANWAPAGSAGTDIPATGDTSGVSLLIAISLFALGASCLILRRTTHGDGSREL